MKVTSHGDPVGTICGSPFFPLVSQTAQGLPPSSINPFAPPSTLPYDCQKLPPVSSQLFSHSPFTPSPLLTFIITSWTTVPISMILLTSPSLTIPLFFFVGTSIPTHLHGPSHDQHGHMGGQIGSLA